MKILAPLKRFEEVEPLVRAGADQFYCGLVNRRSSLNDRPNTDAFNFSTVEELARSVERARSLKKKTYLTINSLATDLEEAMHQVDFARRIGMAGIIVSHVLLMRQIRDRYRDLEVSTSCLNAVSNSQAVSWVRSLGASTIHFPRQLGLQHLESIARKSPGVKLSVFALRGMCVNMEAFCNLHYLRKEYWMPCKHFKVLRIIGKSNISAEAIERKITMPPFSCALCALRRLQRIGIYSLKIEGRGIDSDKKVLYVSLLKKALSSLRRFTGEKEYRRFCKDLFKESLQTPCKPEYCYF